MPTTTSIAHELWTADEFLDWLEPGVFADLIDGEILMHSPVSLLHGNLTSDPFSANDRPKGNRNQRFRLKY
jgi:Uma2 family endonuclease